MRGYLIRRATTEDASTVYDLVQRAYEPWVEVMGRRPQPMDEDYSVLLAENEGWLALEGEELRAVIVLAHRKDHLWVDNVAVDPAAQARGLGQKLLGLAAEKARDAGLPELRLLTHELMASNLALYERLGWTRYVPDEPLADCLVYFRKPVEA